ncbi:uncharacterized protein ACB058_010186 isoform 2-T3 [Synchiropus picturatus]
MPYGFVNHQQGACFPCQKEQVPALEGGSVSSPGSFHNVKQCDQTKPCPEPSPQVLTSKRKRGVEPNGVYIRRPPNAFMVFMRENREIVTRTLKPKHSVETNTILGEMVEFACSLCACGAFSGFSSFLPRPKDKLTRFIGHRIELPEKL